MGVLALLGAWRGQCTGVGMFSKIRRCSGNHSTGGGHSNGGGVVARVLVGAAASVRHAAGSLTAAPCQGETQLIRRGVRASGVKTDALHPPPTASTTTWRRTDVTCRTAPVCRPVSESINCEDSLGTPRCTCLAPGSGVVAHPAPSLPCPCHSTFLIACHREMETSILQEM